jgi:hypothetical protein
LNSARRDATSELSVNVIRLLINVLNLELMVESLFEPAVEPPEKVALGWAFLDRAQYGWVTGTAKDAP